MIWFTGLVILVFVIGELLSFYLRRKIRAELTIIRSELMVLIGRQANHTKALEHLGVIIASQQNVIDLEKKELAGLLRLLSPQQN